MGWMHLAKHLMPNKKNRIPQWFRHPTSGAFLIDNNIKKEKTAKMENFAFQNI